jgi:hypothetical protein
MRKYLFFFVFIGLSVLSSAQILQPGYFALQSSAQNNTESFLLGLPNNDIIMFWYDSLALKVKSSRSTDNGSTWSAENTITTFINVPLYNVDINAIVLNSGRILLTYKNHDYKLHYSDDNGVTWQQLPSFNIRPNPPLRARVYLSSFAKTSDGKVVFVHSDGANISNNYNAQGIYYCKSLDGIYWEQYVLIDSLGRNGNWVSLGQNKDMIVFHDSTLNGEDIFYRITTDGGQTWSQREILIDGEHSQKNARVIKDTTDKYWLFFEDEELTIFNNLTQFDINYITSTDFGITWSPKQKFTSYKGIDKSFSLSTWNGKPVLSFASSRKFSPLSNKLQIYYGIGGETLDTNGPPYLFYHTVRPEFINASDPVTFRAWILDNDVIDSVLVVLKEAENDPVKYLMYDDGLHNDSLSNDNIYGSTLQNGFDNGTLLNYNFYSVDDLGNNSSFSFNPITIPTLNTQRDYLLDVNKLKLPLNNRGILAAVNISGQSAMQFEESIMLFSGGFMISGQNALEEWACGVASSALVENFLAGPVESDPNDLINSIYTIKNTDPAFGTSWQQYRFAVQSGADFYDGNNDGIYNPVDINSNGIWDTDEDKPDMFGDETAWCVFNDGQPEETRVRYAGVAPQGIDIQQTIFAINEDSNPIDNMIFVRYRIINRGTVADNFDDVYFTVWSDPDVGLGFMDELVGSDTLLNLGYCYNDSLDESYGSTPPAIGTPVLQGPPVYIAGETYIDVNGDLQFTPGIDTPLDSAYSNNGNIGTQIFPGAKNLGITSFYYTDCGNPVTDEPNNVEEARNVMKGMDKIGEYTNPCDWFHGMVLGVPCEDVNPIFFYSGNPVEPYGWIHVTPCDMRMWTNIGPFELPANEKVDIWTAYIVGRGNNNLNSITKLKEYTNAAKNYYNSNFTQLPVGVNETPITVSDYQLFQNYPNPFNPTTKIRYTIPKSGSVNLKVFNILGQEVKILVNEFQTVGRYEVDFSSNGLASGVYIYRLKVNGFDQSKKMIILK